MGSLEEGDDNMDSNAPKWIEELFTIKCRIPLGLHLSSEGEIDSLVPGGQAESEGIKAGSWIVEIRSSKSTTFVDSLDEIQKTIEDIVKSGRTNFKIVTRREKTDEDEYDQTKRVGNIDPGPKEIQFPFPSHNPPPPPPPPREIPKSPPSVQPTTVHNPNQQDEKIDPTRNTATQEEGPHGPLAFVPNRVAFWRRNTQAPQDDDSKIEASGAPPVGTVLSEPLLSSNIKAPPVGTVLPMDVVEVKKLVKAAKPDPKTEKSRKELTKFLKDHGFLNFKEALMLFGAENVSELADDSLITEQELVSEVGFTKIQARRLKMETQQYIEENQGVRSGRSQSNIIPPPPKTSSPRTKKTPTVQGIKKNMSGSQMKTQSSSPPVAKMKKVATPKNTTGKSFLERQAEQEAKRLAKLEQSRLQKEAAINKEMKSTPTISSKGKQSSSAGAANGVKSKLASPRVTQSRGTPRGTSISRSSPRSTPNSTPRGTPRGTPRSSPRTSPRTSPLLQGRSAPQDTLDLAATQSMTAKRTNTDGHFRDRSPPPIPRSLIQKVRSDVSEEENPRQILRKKTSESKRGKSEEPLRSSSKLYESAAIMKQRKEERKKELERLQKEKELDMIGPDGRTKRQVLADQKARKEQNKQRLLRKKNSQSEAENFEEEEFYQESENKNGYNNDNDDPYSEEIKNNDETQHIHEEEEEEDLGVSQTNKAADGNRWNRGSINMLMEENKNGVDEEGLIEDEEVKHGDDEVGVGTTEEVDEGMLNHFQNMRTGSFFESFDEDFQPRTSQSVTRCSNEVNNTLRSDSDELRRVERLLQDEEDVLVDKEAPKEVQVVKDEEEHPPSDSLKDKLEQLEKMSVNIEGKIEMRRSTSKRISSTSASSADPQKAIRVDEESPDNVKEPEVKTSNRRGISI